MTLTGHGPESVTAFHLDEAVGIYGQRVAGAAFLGDERFLALWDLAGWAAIWVALAVAAGAVALAARHHPRLALSAAAGSVALLAVPLVLRGTAELAPDERSLSGGRYMLVPVALLLVACLAGLDRAGSRRARQAFTLLLVVAAVSGLGAATVRGDGPSWDETLQRACAGDARTADVLIAPAVAEKWHVRLDCRQLASAGACPSCPRSRPSAATWRRTSTGAGSTGSRSTTRAGRSRWRRPSCRPPSRAGASSGSAAAASTSSGSSRTRPT